MIDVDYFLAEVAENRRRAQSAARSRCALPAGPCHLPLALDLMIENGGLVQPVLARSPFAQRSARVGVPSAEREQIEYWFACCGDEANWLLDTESSRIIAIEFTSYAPPYGLFRRSGEYQAFERTLRFDTPERSFALFSVPPGRRMANGWSHNVRWRTPVLIPPSRVLWGADGEYEFEFSYVDPDAPLLPAPETLLGLPVRPY